MTAPARAATDRDLLAEAAAIGSRADGQVTNKDMWAAWLLVPRLAARLAELCDP